MRTRLRVHPLERFASQEHLIDLNKTITTLQQEDYPVLYGHRQITVFKHGTTTLLVYDFEPGGELGAEVANGVVTISVIGGSLAVHTSKRRYDLSVGTIQVLAPGVACRIVAHQPCQLLFAVYLEQASQDAGRDAFHVTGSPEGKERNAALLATGIPGAAQSPAEVAAAECLPPQAAPVSRAIMRWDDEGGAVKQLCS